MNIEVEAKYYLTVATYALLEKYISNNKFMQSKKVTESDTYYSRADVDFMKTLECLRIRTSDNYAELTYKPPTSEEMLQKGAIWKHEVNLPVNGHENEALELLKYLGCKKLVTVKKKRIAYKKASITIAVDEIDGLGSFVEIEVMANEENVEDAKQMLKNIAEEIGLSDKDKPDLPYRDLLMKKLGTY